jgi:hypothetical protein
VGGFSRNAAPGYPPKAAENRDPGHGTWFDKYPGRAATAALVLRNADVIDASSAACQRLIDTHYIPTEALYSTDLKGEK